MFTYFQTTSLILLWCLALSYVWAHLVFWRVVHRPSRQGRPGTLIILPSIAIAPAILLLAYQLGGWNLLFPVIHNATTGQLATAAIAPAIVLLCASGIGINLTSQVRREWEFWRDKPCATLARALGSDMQARLRPLVIRKSLLIAWGQGLPWLFGELIVVEALFAAPGLGLDAWNRARIRDLPGLGVDLMWIGGLFIAVSAATYCANRQLGRRLASYA